MNPATNAARSFPLDQSRDSVIPSIHKMGHAATILREGAWRWDVRTDTTVWSEPLYGIIGREDATIPPFREHFCFHTAESWIRLVDATLELLQNGTPYELRLQMLHADGSRRRVLRSGEAVRNERGDILELCGTVQDISDWKAEAWNAARDCQKRSSAHDETNRLIQVQEAENAKRASELRDNICQRMALLAVKIQSFPSTVPDLPAESQTQIESLWEETKGILVELHRVSDRLYPLVLDVLGLPLAIRSLCREFTREHGLAIEYSCSDVPANCLNKQSGLVLYRVLEELLANAASHSGANNVTVALDCDSEELRLRISEVAVSFPQGDATTVPSVELGRIKLQIARIGGTLAVWSQPSCGTLIETRTPLSVQSNANPSGH